MRIGEVLALRNSDIDLNYDVIHVTRTLTKNKDGKAILGKTTKTYAGTRDVPILSTLHSVLSTMQIADNDKLLFTYNNKIITPSTINAHIKRIAKNADIQVYTKQDSHFAKTGKNKNLKTSKVTTHMLRHSFATRCIENGMQAVVLSKILGHKDIETTLNTYTSVFEQFTDKEIKKIDDFFTTLQ